MRWENADGIPDFPCVLGLPDYRTPWWKLSLHYRVPTVPSAWDRKGGSRMSKYRQLLGGELKDHTSRQIPYAETYLLGAQPRE